MRLRIKKINFVFVFKYKDLVEYIRDDGGVRKGLNTLVKEKV